MCQKCRNKHGAGAAGVLDKTDGDGGCISGVPATVLILSVLPERFCSCLTELWVNILCSDWWPAPRAQGRPRHDARALNRIRAACANYLKCDKKKKSVIKGDGLVSGSVAGRLWPTSSRCSDGEAALKITSEVPTVLRVPSVPVGPLHIPIWRTVSWLNP